MFNDEILSTLSNYPLINPVQTYVDERGIILNIADGDIGDVAVIISEAGTVRANHFHNEDWHICHLVQGRLVYFWKDSQGSRSQKIEIVSGMSVVTPPLVPHKFEFIENSTMVVISKLSRLKVNYDTDTNKLNPNIF
jgi:dTDP-4-dehydrorhamnose 3,5-epimerase-like enzyme